MKIDPEIIRSLRTSTCGIVFLPVPHDQLSDAAILLGGNYTSANSQLVGTGFLIRSDLILTNRHVVEEIVNGIQDNGVNNWYLRFSYPEQGAWSESFLRAKNAFAFVDPKGRGILDAGIISFDREDGMNQCQPVQFGSLSDIEVGRQIAMSGYPLGNTLINNDRMGIHRFGPVVHQGMISAISPFDTANRRSYTSILTDIYSAPGFSGSPLFLPESGEVVGIHYGGAEILLGCAIPIDKKRIDGWIRFYESVFIDLANQPELKLRDGGDIVFDSERPIGSGSNDAST